jgi:small subunit ribosomal protein S20
MEVWILANIKSAKKRILVSRARTERNKSIRSQVKTAMKKVFAAIASGDKAAATTELAAATKCIEMAASKGVYHKNNMARKVSRISKAVNQMN